MHRASRLRLLVWRARAVLAVRLASGSPEQPRIARDVTRRHQQLQGPAYAADDQLAWLLARHLEFRALFWARLRQAPLVRRRVAMLLHKPPRTPEIVVDELGGGLFLQHGFSTIVVARRIGEDCWINQQVTVGWDAKGGCPTIGDRVTINAGAMVIGGVHVGDDAVIGANTTVTKDVPAGATVVGAGFRVLPASEGRD